MNLHPTRAAVALAAVLALALGACGGSGDDGAEPAAASAPATTSATAAAPTVTGAWARSTPDVAKTSAIYATIASDADDRLVGVDVDASVAGMATLHETTAAGGDTAASSGMEMMEMRSVDGIDVPAGGSVELAPGGFHVMLEQLAAPLAAGSTIAATFRFASGAAVAVEVEVRDA